MGNILPVTLDLYLQYWSPKQVCFFFRNSLILSVAYIDRHDNSDGLYSPNENNVLWSRVNGMDVAFERTRNRMVKCSEDALGDGKGQGSSFGYEGCHVTFLDDCKRIPYIGSLWTRRPAPLEGAVSEAHLIVPRNTSMISIDETIRKEN